MSSQPVVFDDGSVSQVPPEKLHDALTQGGGKLAQHMAFDDGSHAWVPLDKVHEAVTKGGGQLTPPPVPKPDPEMYSDLGGVAYHVGQVAKDALPAAGATVGAIAGAAAGPPGVIGGSALGGAAGEAAKQLVNRAGGEEAPATSAAAARDIAKEGGIQGALGAGGEVIGAAAGPLKQAAVSGYTRALNPTTAINKAVAKKIAPELIDRGVSGSLKGIEERAGGELQGLNPKLDAAYAATPASATKGSGTQIVSDLDALKAKYVVNGKVAQPQAVKAIENIQELVKDQGADISPDNLRKLKSIFDDPVAAKGGYAGADLSTKYAVKAQKVAANSIRTLMGQASPEVAALNKEVSFWMNVQKVTTATMSRQTGQQGGLIRVLAPLGAGAAGAAGLATHGAAASAEAAGAAAVAAGMAQAMRSPLWRTTSAVWKDRLADTIARGETRQAVTMLSRLTVAAERHASRQQSDAPQPTQ